MRSKALNQTTGKLGEQLGEVYLKKHGYHILERNVRSPFGEIDLVANHQGILVFIEIKTRRNRDFGFAEEAVDRHKKNQLVRLAAWYLMRYPKQPPARFDVLAIYVGQAEPEIHLIQDAFSLETNFGY